MKKKLVAIASADWHLHRFRDFDKDGSRLQWAVKASAEIIGVALSHTVPVILAGDLIHTPKSIETETNIAVQNLFRNWEIFGIDFIAISGNHDLCERNTLIKRSPSHLEAIGKKNFYLMDNSEIHYENNNLKIWGIPYLNNEPDLKTEILRLSKKAKKYTDGLKILLLHTDMPGAKTPEGFTIGELETIPNHLDKFFDAWDLVLCGHIHKPQKLSERCYMLGCPIQQNMGNRHDELGYWKVYSDASMEFVPMNNYPKFIQLKKGEEPKDDINYYMPYEDIVEEKDVIAGEFNIKYSKDKLAKKYLAKKHIKSKTKRRALIKILNEE